MQEALSKDTYAPMIEAKSIKRAFIGHFIAFMRIIMV